ncbi:MAG: PspC domain-containing protein [Muribaculaceae bacterium]|nr:PspC domain-containing protein [Muribaculaceae bacterium]
MKKTFAANINGRIFNIDEDAYSLLQNYLHQLRASFGGEEGAEIVSDIEARISELFDERVRSGASVIVLADVNRVIETMGSPEQLGDESDEPNHTQAESPAQPQAPVQPEQPTRKRLFRDMQNKVFGGVVSGLGVYTGWVTWIMRLALVVLALCTQVWPFVIAYMIAWMVIPAANTPRKVLEMYGEPVNVNTIGQQILSSQPTPPPYVPGNEGVTAARITELRREQNNEGGVFSNILRIIATCIMGFLGFLAATGGIAIGFSIIAIIGVLIAGIFIDPTTLNMMPDFFTGGQVTLALICSLSILSFLLIVCIGIIWGACSMVFGVRGAGKKTTIILSSMAIILLILGIALGSILAAAM